MRLTSQRLKIFEICTEFGHITAHEIFVSTESKPPLPESRNAVYKCGLWKNHVTRVV